MTLTVRILFGVFLIDLCVLGLGYITGLISNEFFQTYAVQLALGTGLILVTVAGLIFMAPRGDGTKKKDLPPVL